jgi:uncharacterized damage-inducible protein DinB
MLKRTTGRFLLTVLVITGLAGTVKNTSITSQERKSVVNDLKNTRSGLLNSVKDLSDAQLNFRPATGSWTIRECIYHISSMEKDGWSKLDEIMKEPAAPEKCADITIADEDFSTMVNSLAQEQKKPLTANWKSADAAISAFKTARTNHIKYAKSTTEDLHNHFIQMPFGWVDGYQFMSLMSAHSDHYTQEINEIKKHADFPTN